MTNKIDQKEYIYICNMFGSSKKERVNGLKGRYGREGIYLYLVWMFNTKEYEFMHILLYLVVKMCSVRSRV